VLTIGQFSRITGLTVKTIRLYHEEGLILPARVDPGTGYRYFDQKNVEQARMIQHLRDLAFPLAEIKAILDRSRDDSDILGLLEKQRACIEDRARKLNLIVGALDDIIRRERDAKELLRRNPAAIAEKEVPPLLMASIRWKGTYAETGKYLGRVARVAGRHIRGGPFNLYWDSEYREEDADVESCFPVAEMAGKGDVSVRQLPGALCVSLVHRGPYELLGRSYGKALDYVQSRDHTQNGPVREIYVKGPGMIFKGNPKRYLTEIQIPIEKR
jgi:DNA-binding transcriptional MerR regulator